MADGRVNTILLVEDDTAVRDTIHRLLSAVGYEVLATDDPDRACHLLDDHIVHALILDVRFPKNRSGLDVLEFARAKYRTADLPAIILTGVDLSAGEERTICEAGAHHLQKPADVQELIRFLDKHLRS